MKKLLPFVVVLSLAACEQGPTCGEQYPSKIVQVGGCDRDGWCSVILEDGTELHQVIHPVVGGRLHGYSCNKP